VIIVCENGNHVCLCPLEGVIDVISKKWALLIVNAIGNNERLRFNALMQELNGISPKTLSDTLKQLEAERLIKREAFPEIPPRVEYSLTDDGTELRTSIIPLLGWAAKRTSSEKGKCASRYRGITAHQVKNMTQPS
jgi:DNA-binding HxlR family transcriptional regulator